FFGRFFVFVFFFFFSSRRRHTRSKRDWSSDVCSSDLENIRLSRMMLVIISVGTILGIALLVIIGFKSIGFIRDITQSNDMQNSRSEERRVGKECRYRRAPDHEKKKN